MEVNEFLRAKWIHFFNLMDANKDGIVEKKDFTELAEKVFVVYESNGEPIGMKVLLKRSDRLFNRMLFEMRMMDKEGISPDDWVDWLSQNLSQGEESNTFKRITYNIFKELFNVCDQNNDAFLSKKELTDLYDIFNIDSSEAAIAFSFVDDNNDGKISRSEFLSHIRDFFTSPNEGMTVLGSVSV